MPRVASLETLSSIDVSASGADARNGEEVIGTFCMTLSSGCDLAFLDSNEPQDLAFRCLFVIFGSGDVFGRAPDEDLRLLDVC